MLKKVINFLSGVPMTVVSGVVLLTEIIPRVVNYFGGNINPFWFMPFSLCYISVIISGLPLLYNAIRKLIVNKGISKISSALLVTIAMISACVIGDVFAAGEVAFLMALGEILEDITKERAEKGLKKLINLAPTTIRKIENGNEILSLPSQVEVGDIIRVLPGETISVDGEIINGETSVDQSVMTGEWLPINKTNGDKVYSGTMNMHGAIDIKATAKVENGSLQKLIKLVEESEKKKAPMARIADFSASLLVPLAFLIAVITGLVTLDIYRAVTVLVVFCPCALVLATPTAVMAGIGQATKHGVIIKGGEALENMNKVKIVAFDKTGTITKGVLQVESVVGKDKNLVLQTALTAEIKSEHPIGKAIVKYALENGTEKIEPSEFNLILGKGIVAKVNESEILAGNEKLLTENKVKIPNAIMEKVEEFSSQGKALVLIAKDKKCLGLIALADCLKENAEKTIKELVELGVQPVLLTGDNEKTANYFAKKVGIERVYSSLLPEQKVEKILAFQKDGAVCMVGDGVNDAPALKSATVSVAMAKLGSDIAQDSASICLMNDDIEKLPYIKRLAKGTVNTIKFGITLSMIINIVGVVLSVLGLLSVSAGAIVHNLGSVLVILIATFLYDRKFIKKPKK